MVHPEFMVQRSAHVWSEYGTKAVRNKDEFLVPRIIRALQYWLKRLLAGKGTVLPIKPRVSVDV